ncbi:hypothetical protein [Formosa sp. A9]|uniref:hypothetical protein n=1 Tax=Formosa sp. A9 TaxID=3442641 RepID=UPI003EB9FA27
MATQYPIMITHVFQETTGGEYNTVKHYELKEVRNGVSQLTNKLNLSKDQSFAKSSPDYWLKVREGDKWSECLTGLFKIGKKNFYRGDIDKKKHLLLFEFSQGYSILTIYYFQNFYTKDFLNLTKQIK